MKKRNGWKWALALTILSALSTISMITSNIYDDFVRFPTAAGLTLIFGCLTIWLYTKAKKEAETERAEIAERQRKHQEQLQLEHEAQEEQLRQQREKEQAEALERQKERERKNEELAAQYSDFLNAIPNAEIVVSETPAKKNAVGFVDDLVFSNVTRRSSVESFGDFVAIDVETTGLSVSSAEIVEIAAIRFRAFEPVMKFQTLCMPLRGIPKESEEINGITEEMVEGRPTFQKIAGSLQEFIGNDNIVAHNLEFDLKFIVKYGVDITEKKRRYYDTLKIAQNTLKKAKTKWDKEVEAYMPDINSEYDVDDYKLGTLSAYYGIPLFGAHRALADCYAAGRLFESLIQDKIG